MSACMCVCVCIKKRRKSTSALDVDSFPPPGDCLHTTKATHERTPTEGIRIPEEKASEPLQPVAPFHPHSSTTNNKKARALIFLSSSSAPHTTSQPSSSALPLFECETFSSAMTHCFESIPAAQCPSV